LRKKELGPARHENMKTSKFIFRKIQKLSPLYIPFTAFYALIANVSPLLNVFLTKFLVDSLLANKEIKEILFYVMLIVASNGFIAILSAFVNNKRQDIEELLLNNLDIDICANVQNVKYELLEDPEIHNLKSRAFKPIKNQGVITTHLESITNLIKGAVLLFSMITVVLIVDVRILLLIIPLLFITVMLRKKIDNVEYECENDLALIDRRYEYYDKLIHHMEFGKDIRLYNMSPYILDKVQKDNDETLAKGFGRMYRLFGRYQSLSDVINHLLLVGIYLFWAYKVIRADIGIGDYAMLIAATI
jgi:ABC-type bacteriocin/lantibiotic exporter with double-glycine peptidase domain